MLVLSRQRDETIMIGDDIEITIVDVRGEKVRLGINAPTHIAVHRKEVYAAITRENAEAARITGDDLRSLQPPAPPGVATPSRAAELATPRPPGAAPVGAVAGGGAPPDASSGSDPATADTLHSTDSRSARSLRRTA